MTKRVERLKDAKLTWSSQRSREDIDAGTSLFDSAESCVVGAARRGDVGALANLLSAGKFGKEFFL
jgi:hypothetical protein